MSSLINSRYPKDRVEYVTNELQAYIQRHNLAPGDRLPSQSALAAQFDVSRGSLREALARLQTQGVIRQIHGVGTFVSGDLSLTRTTADLNLNITEMIRKQGMEPGTGEINLLREPVPPEVAACLNIDPSTDTLCVKRVRTADGVPFAYSSAYLAPEVSQIDFEPDEYEGSLYKFLQVEFNEFVTSIDARIEISTIDAEISRKLKLPANSSALVLKQCHYNRHGKPLSASTEYFVQNRFKFKIIVYQPGG